MHLFFDCVVAKQVWEEVNEIIEYKTEVNFESVASRWLCNKKFLIQNMTSSANLWTIWKVRNLLCFQNGNWRDVTQLWSKATALLKNWRIICPKEELQKFDTMVERMQAMCSRPKEDQGVKTGQWWPMMERGS